MYSRRKHSGLNTWFWVFLIVLLGVSVTVTFWIAFNFRLNKRPTKSIESLSSIPPLSEDVAVTPVERADSTSLLGTSDDSLISEPKYAPNFTLNTLTDTPVSLSDYTNHPVIINFWASWCAPCRVEMPALIEAYETYKDGGLVVLAVNTSFQDNITDVRAFVDEFEIPFPILLDSEGRITNDLYTVFGLPTTYFVDPSGAISRTYIGAMTEEQIWQFTLELMSE